MWQCFVYKSLSPAFRNISSVAFYMQHFLVRTCLQTITYMSIDHHIHVYRPSHTCLQTITYMSIDHHIHVYRPSHTCQQTITYMSIDHHIHVYRPSLCFVIHMQYTVYIHFTSRFTFISIFAANVAEVLLQAILYTFCAVIGDITFCMFF